METEKIKKILLGRMDKLSDFEREWMYENNNGWYNRYLFDYYSNKSEGYSDSMWESFWFYSFFGQHYLHSQGLAKKFLSCEG